MSAGSKRRPDPLPRSMRRDPTGDCPTTTNPLLSDVGSGGLGPHLRAERRREAPRMDRIWRAPAAPRNCNFRGETMRGETMKRGIVLGLALLAAPAIASEGDAAYRKHVMEAVGGHMQAIADIMKQTVPHTAHLGLHANAMADLASISDTLFPAGSEGGDALPEIWSNPDDFAKKVAAFKEAATGLKTAVASGEGVGPAMQSLGQACKSCHDSYRKKD
jgi:cytochrome c556